MARNTRPTSARQAATEKKEETPVSIAIGLENEKESF